MNTEKLPPEIEKIRDENANSLRVDYKDLMKHHLTYKQGFNDAFHLGRKFERDELAKRAPEFDAESARFESKKLVAAQYDSALFVKGARWQHQKTSLHYEAVIEKLKDEIEIERMKVAACGVAAMQNTIESKKERIDSNNVYYSASYGDVCRAVDAEIELRSKLAKAEADLKKALDGNTNKPPSLMKQRSRSWKLRLKG